MDLVLKSLSMSAFGKEISIKAEKMKKKAVNINMFSYYIKHDCIKGASNDKNLML